MTGRYCSPCHLIYDPEARITLTAHADVRGRSAENQSLSERRANRVKPSLVTQGVPEGKIDIVALGERQNLSPAEVLKLHDENPNKHGFAKRNSQALVWAYNRRVDITLLPMGQSQRNSSLEMRMRPNCSSEVRGRAGARWKRQGTNHRLVKHRVQNSHRQKRPLYRRNRQTKSLDSHGCKTGL